MKRLEPDATRERCGSPCNRGADGRATGAGRETGGAVGRGPTIGAPGLAAGGMAGCTFGAGAPVGGFGTDTGGLDVGGFGVPAPTGRGDGRFAVGVGVPGRADGRLPLAAGFKVGAVGRGRNSGFASAGTPRPLSNRRLQVPFEALLRSRLRHRPSADRSVEISALPSPPASVAAGLAEWMRRGRALSAVRPRPDPLQ